MPSTRFPGFPDPADPETPITPEGIIAIGNDLRPETLVQAYRLGIFPWPIEGVPALTWFCPPLRGVLEFSRLHIPRSLARAARKKPFTFSIDRAFSEVITACARTKRPGQDGTWITKSLARAYVELHRLGYAHSVEAWEGETLVGGLYGVDCGGAFAGESMFYRKPYASKLALLHLIEHFGRKGLDWMDIQMLTPHMQALGAREITRGDFLKRLAGTLARNRVLFP